MINNCKQCNEGIYQLGTMFNRVCFVGTSKSKLGSFLREKKVPSFTNPVEFSSLINRKVFVLDIFYCSSRERDVIERINI